MTDTQKTELGGLVSIQLSPSTTYTTALGMKVNEINTNGRCVDSIMMFRDRRRRTVNMNVKKATIFSSEGSTRLAGIANLR